ncbi:MAG TPA: cytochrome c [Beijerinckiaceae bacterium]|nr:cytochrome c [Beijerinckiaceae bacterium]
MLASAAASAEPDRERLKHLLVQECGSCHGLTLNGGLGRPLTREALANFPVETVRDIILDGLPGTPMPPWRPLLSIPEASVIADMLKSGEIR